MAQPDPIRLRYATEFTRLSLWYVHKVMGEGETDFEGVVNGRVNIYRNTSFYDGVGHPAHAEVGPAWGEILAGIRASYEKHRNDASAAGFEAEGLCLLWPYLEARLRLSREGRGGSSTRPYECWTFDYKRPDRLAIHIANVYKPRSPLSEMRVPFAASLARLLRDSQALKPDVTIVRCGTWLNAVQPFLDLFPNSWGRSLQPSTRVGYGMGHWGQFMDRRGDFHDRNGTTFRVTGSFPYPPSTGESPIDEVLNHLKTRFPEMEDLPPATGTASQGT